MPAFGPTDAFREASGFPREFGAYSFDQYRQWLDQQERARNQGDQLRDFLANFNLSRLTGGYSDPRDIRTAGQQVMPGVDEALASRRGRLNDIARNFDSSRPDTMGSIWNRYNDQAGDIVRTGDQSQGEIDRLHGNVTGREDSAHGSVVGNLRDTDSMIRGGIEDTFGGLRRGNSNTTQNILDRYQRGYGDLGGANTNVSGNARNNWLSTFQDLSGRSANAYGDTRADLGGTIGQLESGARDTAGRIGAGNAAGYGRLQGDTADTYRGLEDSNEELLGESITAAEKLNPVGDFRAAQRARSFAPLVANTKQRLRRAGVGAGDLQGIEALNDVESARARAMDDEVAQSSGEYTDRLNALRAQQQSGRERLGVGRLNTNIGLTQDELAATERNERALRDTMERLGLTRYSEGRDLNLGQLDNDQRMAIQRELGRQGIDFGELERNIGLRQNEMRNSADAIESGLNREINLGVGQSDRSLAQARDTGQQYRDEVLRHTNAGNAADTQRAAGNLTLLDTQYGRTADWRNQGNQNDMLARAIADQDWNTVSNLMREQNSEDLTDLDVRNAQYDRGENWIRSNYGIQDTAAGNLSNIMARDQARQMDAARIAQGYGQQARDAYGQTYQQEAGKGGWGSRLIGGLASAAAPLLSAIPGVGPFLSAGASVGGGALSGAGGGSAGAYPGGGGTYGSGQGGGGSPYSFSWLTNQFQKTANNRANTAATNPQYSAPNWLQLYQQTQTPQPYRVS